MPIYEYECEQCGKRFDRMQSIKDEPVRQCPECSGLVHKVFHAAGIIFKGSGWYITDSRKSSSGTVTGETKTNGGSESKDDKKTTSTTTSPDAKSETKTEAKSDTKAGAKAEVKPAGG
jgi:putative FmdB family regulatory protein